MALRFCGVEPSLQDPHSINEGDSSLMGQLLISRAMQKTHLTTGSLRLL